ncbi:hypothetical protein ADK67_32580 [Saccharothrix sp. NRRL B-16348]|nr:hypothetical protein ADK67_32580 [Saccharothrix sp. NRRL B-16348]
MKISGELETGEFVGVCSVSSTDVDDGLPQDSVGVFLRRAAVLGMREVVGLGLGSIGVRVVHGRNAGW